MFDGCVLTEVDATPFAPAAERVGDLIGCLECCHHKAQRHVELLIEAIGRGGTDDGGVYRPHGRPHAAQRVWQDAVRALRAWLAGDMSSCMDVRVGDVFADELLVALGPPTPLKRWQVERVIERIDSFLDPATHYRYLRRPDYDLASDEPDDVEYLFRTRRTLIHEPGDLEGDGLSLAVAIDMLMPCNWNFPRNLRIVLRAIGGTPRSDEPFAACGRNIALNPIRRQMVGTLNALDRFCGRVDSGPVDFTVLATLGDPTALKQGLAAALAGRIKSQLRL